MCPFKFKSQFAILRFSTFFAIQVICCYFSFNHLQCFTTIVAEYLLRLLFAVICNIVWQGETDFQNRDAVREAHKLEALCVKKRYYEPVVFCKMMRCGIRNIAWEAQPPGRPWFSEVSRSRVWQKIIGTLMELAPRSRFHWQVVRNSSLCWWTRLARASRCPGLGSESVSTTSCYGPQTALTVTACCADGLGSRAPQSPGQPGPSAQQAITLLYNVHCAGCHCLMEDQPGQLRPNDFRMLKIFTRAKASPANRNLLAIPTFKLQG